MREIRINPALNGFIAKVGCQTLVFNTVEALVEHLGGYLKNPEEYEKEFLEKHAINRKYTLGDLNQPQAQAQPTQSETLSPYAGQVIARGEVVEPLTSYGGILRGNTTGAGTQGFVGNTMASDVTPMAER